jgi:DNA-binding beta-propeller fold protein YncE
MTVLARMEELSYPSRISVNAADGSCWVTDPTAGEVLHIGANGEALVRIGGFQVPRTPAVNSADGSCWVTDYDADEVIHLSASGVELWRGTGFNSPDGIAVNPTDGTCWVAAGPNCSDVAHLDEDGSVLWQGDWFQCPDAFGVNPTDGSCWVGDDCHAQVARLAVVGYQGPLFPDVQVYFWAYEEVEACYGAGVVSGYPDGLYHPAGRVTRDQMAVYISRALAGGNENVPEFTDTPTFPDVGVGHWALDHVEYAVNQNVVAGYDDGTYHPNEPVTRDQMAVYVARALVAPTGEAALEDYLPADPRDFADVGAEFWAYKHIEYCVENGTVAGYLDGLYHPEVIVTRDQMAVYIARTFELSGTASVTP